MAIPRKYYKYRVMLDAEDGVYCVEDDFSSEKVASDHIDHIRDNYGEGQTLFIESYRVYY